MKHILEGTQVNVPFPLLKETYRGAFLKYRLNPEIGFDGATLDHTTVGEVQQVVGPLHESGLSITLHGPFMDLSPGSPDPAVRGLTRRRFEQLLELVPILKPRAVVCHAGYERRRYAFMREAWLKRSCEVWAWLADRLAEFGGLLMLENVYERGPEDLLPLFERLKEKKVGFCLDTGHQSAFGKASLMEWVDTLDPYLGEIHLHDNEGGQDDHLALGKGRVAFPLLFNRLKKRGRSPILTLEPHREEDLWPSLEYLREVNPW
jgi:sugar phosphate isomerase/epimerase